MQFARAGASICFLFCVVAFAQQPAQQPRGVPARSTPGEYPAHFESNGTTYAAALISGDEVKHIFAFDISKSYVVFEVAAYPANASRPSIDPSNFLLRIAQSGDFLHPVDSETVASVIQHKNLPRPPSKVPPVVASTEVGYETGRDPYTGQRVHGTYTNTQVGVGTGRDPGPPPSPSPGGYPQDRELLENQLWDKSFPTGDVVRPTAGYLYFPSSLLKKKSNGGYELQYLALDAAASEKIQLQIPAKNH